MYRVAQEKPHIFKKCITPVYNDVGRRSIHPYVQLFITSKTDILNVATFKYSSRHLSMTFIYCTQFSQNGQSSLTMNISVSTAIQPVYSIP